MCFYPLWACQDSNLGPVVYKTTALPTELRVHKFYFQILTSASATPLSTKTATFIFFFAKNGLAGICPIDQTVHSATYSNAWHSRDVGILPNTHESVKTHHTNLQSYSKSLFLHTQALFPATYPVVQHSCSE